MSLYKNQGHRRKKKEERDKGKKRKKKITIGFLRKTFERAFRL